MIIISKRDVKQSLGNYTLYARTSSRISAGFDLDSQNKIKSFQEFTQEEVIQQDFHPSKLILIVNTNKKSNALVLGVSVHPVFENKEKFHSDTQNRPENKSTSS